MAAAGANTAGEDIKVYQAAVISDKSETNLEAAITSANEVVDITAFTFPSETRGAREKNVLGSDVTMPFPGKIAYGESAMTIMFDPSNTKHVAIRDDDLKTDKTYIVVYEETATNSTYAAFDGFITAATAATADDAFNTMDVTIQATSGITWVDNS